MVTKEQWLELHRVCLDTVRSAIRGLSGEMLVAKPWCERWCRSLPPVAAPSARHPRLPRCQGGHLDGGTDGGYLARCQRHIC